MGGRRIPFYAYTTKICKKTIVAQYKYFILVNFMAASVIIGSFYQDTLAQAITLAVFLPIKSDMMDVLEINSVAVTLRELFFGLVATQRNI